MITEGLDRPLMVDRYPTQVKAFYFEPDPDRPELALGVDVIAPEGYGESIGGGQRIHNLDLLLKRLEEHKLPPEAFNWYIDLRKYGSVPHAGFGMGIERFVAWMCGLEHIRETIPYPRMLYRTQPMMNLAGSQARLRPASHSLRVEVRHLPASTSMQKSHIAIIGAPLDLGSGRRGVDMGPSAVRVANLNGRLAELGYVVDDLGNVPVVQPESQPEGLPQAKYLPQITETCVRLAEMVAQALAEDKFPLVLGGDHSIAVGTVSGVSKHLRDSKGKLGMIWIDAHTDMNTPGTSPSGNVHGMPLACCIGAGPEELTSIFGYLAESGSRQCRAGRAFAPWTIRSASMCSTPAFMSSPCAISMSAAWDR